MPRSTCKELNASVKRSTLAEYRFPCCSTSFCQAMLMAVAGKIPAGLSRMKRPTSMRASSLGSRTFSTAPVLNHRTILTRLNTKLLHQSNHLAPSISGQSPSRATESSIPCSRALRLSTLAPDIRNEELVDGKCSTFSF